MLEPLEPLGKKLLIMRNVDQVRCDEKGINAHYDGASGAFTAEPPDGEAKAGGPSIDQVIRKTHYPEGLPPGMAPTLIGGTFFRRSRVGRYVHSYNLDGTVAATMQEKPRDLFNRVFGTVATSGDGKDCAPRPAQTQCSGCGGGRLSLLHRPQLAAGRALPKRALPIISTVSASSNNAPLR